MEDTQKTIQNQTELCRQLKCLFVCDTDMHAQSDERLEGSLPPPSQEHVTLSQILLSDCRQFPYVDASLPCSILEVKLKALAVALMWSCCLFVHCFS